MLTNLVTEAADVEAYRRDGRWDGSTLSGRLVTMAEERPERLAVVDREGSATHSYAELERDVSIFAAWLEDAGVGRRRRGIDPVAELVRVRRGRGGDATDRRRHQPLAAGVQAQGIAPCSHRRRAEGGVHSGQLPKPRSPGRNPSGHCRVRAEPRARGGRRDTSRHERDAREAARSGSATSWRPADGRFVQAVTTPRPAPYPN